MRGDPAVDQWFTSLQHRLKPVMQRVREVILGADQRMAEQVR
jgi:hypothetical protein